MLSIPSIDRFFRLLILFFLPCLALQGRAQCCSTGSPVGASVYVGVIGKQYLRTIAFYRHGYSDTYYTGHNKATSDNQLAWSKYDFAGLAMAYGITRRLTAEIEAGYYFNKTQHFKSIDFETRGYGISNGNLLLKYGAFVRPSRQIELTAGAGLRFPFGLNPQVVDGVQLNRDVQPSTNAFGTSLMLFFNKGFPAISLRLFTINRYDVNFPDKSEYKYGNTLLNAVFISKKLAKYLFGLLQLRNEWKTNDQDFANPNEHGGDAVINSGFVLITLTPQLTFSLAGKWNISALYDIPLYKYYNGKQMTPGYSLAISLTRDIDLVRKTPAIDPAGAR